MIFIKATKPASKILDPPPYKNKLAIHTVLKLRENIPYLR